MNQVATIKSSPLIKEFAENFGVDQAQVFDILKATAFKQKDAPATDEQIIALMVVANEYGLNPFVKEIYAYPDKNGGIVPVVSVDGWSRIMNDHKQMDGIDFRFSEETVTHHNKNCHVWMECIIRRKDRSSPIVIREYFDEVVRDVNFKTPWESHPRRMHRHKTLIQAARVAFGFGGIYDEDEAQRILEKEVDGEVLSEPQKIPEKSVEATIEYCSDAKFAENEPKWMQVIESGKKSAQSLIEFIETKYLLTDDQKKKLHAVVIPEPEPLSAENKDFANALGDNQ